MNESVSLFLCCVFIVGLYVVELLRMNESSGMTALLRKSKALFFCFVFPIISVDVFSPCGMRYSVYIRCLPYMQCGPNQLK